MRNKYLDSIEHILQIALLVTSFNFILMDRSVSEHLNRIFLKSMITNLRAHTSRMHIGGFMTFARVFPVKFVKPA